MTRYCNIDIEAAEKALEKGDVQTLLDMVSPDIEDRNLLDAYILAETSEISALSPEKRIDLLGQAIFIAYQFREDFEEYGQLLHHSGHLAYQQLLKKMESLDMEPSLWEEPIGVIAKLYPKPDDLYYNQKCEALRISQVYLYLYLYGIDKAPPEEQDDLRAYTVALCTLAVGYSSAAGCFFECMTMAEIAVDVIAKIDAERWLKTKPESIRLDMRNALHDIALKAVKAARQLHRDSEAAKWAGFADSLSGCLGENGDSRSFLSERGDLLLVLGKAEKALETFEKIKSEPHSSSQDIKKAIRKEEWTKFNITGDWKNLLNTAFPESLNINDKCKFQRIFDSAATGNANQEDFAALLSLMNKAMTNPTITLPNGDTDPPIHSSDTTDPENLFMLLKAIAQTINAQDDGNLNELLKQLPEIEQVAGGDSLNQLMANFFLIYLRQSHGASITWQSLAPLAARLFDLPPMLFLANLAPLAGILYKMGGIELVKGADTVAALVERVTFDDETERTPLTNFNQTALAMPIIDLLLALLVKISKCILAESNLWLERAARLKYFATYRVQKQQKEVKLFEYPQELSSGDAREVNRMVEALTRYSLATLGKGGCGKLEEKKQLKTLLFPIYSRCRLSYDTTPLDFRFPEIIHVEAARMPGETYVPPLISIVYTGYGWQVYTAKNSLNVNDVKKYMEFITAPYELIKNYNNMNSIAAGVRLRESLIPFADKATSFPIIGVRSSSIYHTIPLDSLPLAVDETVGRVTRWIGEEIVTVLLTGQNQELGELYKSKTVTNVVLFANSSFPGIGLPDLPGVKNEVEAIQRIVEIKSNASAIFYFGPRSNRYNFLRLSGANAPGILHIATHGIVNNNEPSNSCIVLSREDHQGNKVLAAVGYYDIMLMDLRKCDLVVLSTCSTHEGKNILGEGIMGLAWAFKAAGAKAVIGTRWPVNDAAAVEFWKEFYENLFEGIPIGKAFYDARLHIMKQEEWCHPTYWGVFQLIV